MISNGKKAVLHVARAGLGMTEDEYRALLSSVGAESSNDLTRQTFDALMVRLEELGFKSTSGKPLRRRPVNSAGAGRAALMKKLEAQRLDMDLPWAYVDGIARQMFKIERVEWCDEVQLKKIVAALVYRKSRR